MTTTTEDGKRQMRIMDPAAGDLKLVWVRAYVPRAAA